MDNAHPSAIPGPDLHGFGTLVATDQKFDRIEAAGAGCAAVFGQAAATLLGQPTAALFSRPALHRFRNILSLSNISERREVLAEGDTALPDHLVTLHRAGSHCILECLQHRRAPSLRVLDQIHAHGFADLALRPHQTNWFAAAATERFRVLGGADEAFFVRPGQADVVAMPPRSDARSTAQMDILSALAEIVPRGLRVIQTDASNVTPCVQLRDTAPLDLSLCWLQASPKAAREQAQALDAACLLLIPVRTLATTHGMLVARFAEPPEIDPGRLIALEQAGRLIGLRLDTLAAHR